MTENYNGIEYEVRDRRASGSVTFDGGAIGGTFTQYPSGMCHSRDCGWQENAFIAAKACQEVQRIRYAQAVEFIEAWNGGNPWNEGDELKALIQATGDAIVDVIRQLDKGKWTDDHGHQVVNNKAMTTLGIDIMKDLMAFRVKYLDYVDGGTDGRKD